MKSQLKVKVDRYPGQPVKVVVEFELPSDTPNFRAAQFGDVIKQAVADGDFVSGYVSHHHPDTWKHIEGGK